MTADQAITDAAFHGVDRVSGLRDYLAEWGAAV
jgi:hypothetical protein